MSLGWLISVYRQQNDGTAPASFGAPQGARLAVWQTGFDGLNWLDDLVKHQGAIDLGGDGYPLEYTAMAVHIIPRIRVEPPEARSVWTYHPGDIITEKWLGKTTRDAAAMDACRPDEWLIIEVWDES